jgi:hypothetical protein
MATYPSGIYSYTNRQSTDTLAVGTHSTIHNEMAAEMIAVQTELGTNPKGVYVNVTDRLDSLTALIGTQHTQNTDIGSSSATFYLNGSSGAKLKEVGGAYAVRDNADAVYVDFTCAGLTCDDINGITSIQLAAIATDSHTHTNKGLLDTYTQTEANLSDAVSKRHTQNTDTGSTGETFQLNNVNPLSAKVKVDDLDPTVLEVRNGADSAYGPIRAAEFRGYLQADNLDLNRPTIKYNEPTDSWQLSNNGTSFVDIAQGISMAGNTGEIQFNGTTNLAADPLFYYDNGTNTLYVPAIVASGIISGDITGTTSGSFNINNDGDGLILDTAGMTQDRTVNGEDLYNTVQNNHVAATAGTGISVTGQQVANTDRGSTAVSTHEGTYNHATFLGNSLTSAYVFVGNVGNVATGVALSGDVAIDNTGNTTVTIALDDLSNVAVPTPNVDDYLRWNGSNWVNATGGTVSAGPATIFYLDNDSQAGAYQTLLGAPDTVTPEEQDSVVVNNSEGLIGGFLYNTALDNTTISAGIWEFDFYTYVSSAAGVTTLIFDMFKVVTYAGTVAITGAGTSRTATVSGSTPFLAGDANADAHLASYLQTPNGTFQITAFTSSSVVTVATDVGYVNESGVAFTLHRVLFGVESVEIDTLTNPAELITLSAQTGFAINTTDKLALRVYGKTTQPSNITVYISHNSTDHYSHFHAPLAITHNQLSGLQGGTSGQFYHLTSAEQSSLSSIHTQNTDTGTSQNTFAIGSGGAGNKVIQANNADVNKPSLRYDDSNNVWQFSNDGTTWQDMGTGGGGAGMTEDVNQTTHGFAVGDVIRHNGAIYVKAQANSDTNAEVYGIVSAVAGPDDFTIQMGGLVTGLTGLTAGTVYYLSGATAGALTSTEPTTVGYISKPVILSDSTTSGFFYNMRGAAIGNPTAYNVSFTNASLSGGILTVNHALAVDYPNVTVYDNNKKVILPDDITSVTSNQLTIDLSSYGTITGTWYAVVLPVGNTAPAGLVDTTSNQSVGGTKTFTDHPVFPATSNPRNLIKNGNLDCWLAGAGPFSQGQISADGWVVQGGASVAVSRESSTVKLGSYSMKVTSTSPDLGYLNSLNVNNELGTGINYWKGRKVSLSAWVWADTANNARLQINDQITPSPTAYHTGSSTWELLTVTHTVSNSATNLFIQVAQGYAAGTTTSYFNGIILVDGETPYSFAPCFPQEDVWRDATGGITFTGWSSNTARNVWVKRFGKTVFVSFHISGTSNSTNTNFTLPYTAATSTTYTTLNVFAATDNGGTPVPATVSIASGATSAVFYRDIAGNAWTASGTKQITGQFFYESA